MQKPDFARARPSTLLEDDESYEKLFHKNNELNAYYIVSLFGRRIEDNLKVAKKYTATEITDIKFYGLYIASCLMTNSLYPGSKKLSELNSNSLTEEIINYAIETTYDLYRDLGGTDKIAKGSKLREALMSKLREDKQL